MSRQEVMSEAAEICRQYRFAVEAEQRNDRVVNDLNRRASDLRSKGDLYSNQQADIIASNIHEPIEALATARKTQRQAIARSLVHCTEHFSDYVADAKADAANMQPPITILYSELEPAQ